MAIRVLYRWRVTGGRETFEQAWYELTQSMRDGVPGARGSVLTWTEPAASDVAVAVARWDSREAWERRGRHDPNPAAAAAMTEVASLLSVEVLAERFDLTVA